MTLQDIQERAKWEVLSNDKVMRLGAERLKERLRIDEISTKKFWKELEAPEGVLPYKFIMRSAWRSYPKLHLMVHHKSEARPVQSKTEAVTNIGLCLKRAKATTKLICEYMYGNSESKKPVLKRDRKWEQNDFLSLFRFFRVTNIE